MDKYEVVFTNTFITRLLDLLVECNFLKKVEEPEKKILPLDIKKTFSIGLVTNPEIKSSSSFCATPEKLKIEDTDNIPCDEGVDKFLNNHLTPESNMEAISKQNIGMYEERKRWIKELKAAIKEYGRDEIFSAFYDWTLANGNYVGRSPISTFLREAGRNISLISKKPTVTNTSIGVVEQRIAYVSDNKVFFNGEFRIRLASLIKEYGEKLVIQAFEDFFQDVDDKGLPWAARDFLQRAPIMISIIQQKKFEEAASEKLVQDAYAKAQQSVEEVEEEDEEL